MSLKFPVRVKVMGKNFCHHEPHLKARKRKKKKTWRVGRNIMNATGGNFRKYLKPHQSFIETQPTCRNVKNSGN